VVYDTVRVERLHTLTSYPYLNQVKI